MNGIKNKMVDGDTLSLAIRVLSVSTAPSKSEILCGEI